jgi:diguanylate cyclase (GGDEF)-like protein
MPIVLIRQYMKATRLMRINQPFYLRSALLKEHVSKYAFVGLSISISAIIIATLCASYQKTDVIDFAGILLSQKTNPALWVLDLTPLIFTYWGQLFCYELASKMESLLEDQTRDLLNKSNELESKLHYETFHDHLTNLPNQRLLSQRINQGVQQINKGETLAVIILHINAFKEMNTQYSGFIANSILTQFAEKLKTIMLSPYLLQAYMGMNMVARLQGAEFAILIPRLRKEHHFDDLLTKLLVSTSANFMVDGNSIQITTTAGIALCPLHGNDDITLLRHASSGLFYAEKEGLSHAIYESKMDKKEDGTPVALKEFIHAMDDETITLFYQPDLALKTEKIVGAEAVFQFDALDEQDMTMRKLSSWAEGSVYAKKVTDFLLKKAIQQQGLWHKEDQKVTMTVNLFDATDVELPTTVKSLLKEHHVSPEYLKLTLTEKACLSDQTRTITVLKQLAELGVKIAISDFCSGYTSFIYLTNFPISEVKLDKSFIMNMINDEKKMNVVRAVIKMADAMNIIVCADGIVDKNTMKELKKMGYQYGQAPYFYPAVSADEFFSLLASS